MSTDSGEPEPELRHKTQQSPLARQRARESQAPREKRTGRVDGLFPLGYRDTFTQWWTNVPAAVAEHNVLSFVPHLHAAPTQTETGREVLKQQPDGTTETSTSDSLSRTGSQTKTTDATSDPHGPRRWHSNLVRLSGKNRALNEFSVEREGEEVRNNLVVIHGYGAGLGFFYKNFEALSRPAGWRLFALDLLGMGRSSRPPFKIRAKERKDSIREAEDWFVDSLEEWRRIRGLERFTLLGHSLGGYMAVAYALKYPGHLDKLVLVSPVGIPEDPYAVAADLPDPNATNREAEREEQEQDQQEAAAENSAGSKPTRSDNNNFLNARNKRDDATAAGSEPPRRPISRWLTYLWDANVSPFSLVRWSGPLGPRFVSGWTTRRFSHLPPNEAQALHIYAYSLFRQRGSGEYALAYILAPGAFARSPLIRRIAGVGRQTILPSGLSAAAAEAGGKGFSGAKSSEATSITVNNTASATTTPQEARLENGVPIVLLYGENDWMDVAGGYDAADALDAAREQALKNATPAQRQADQGSARVRVVKDAGHHVYLDGWIYFNEIILAEMKDVEKRQVEAPGRGN